MEWSSHYPDIPQMNLKTAWTIADGALTRKSEAGCNSEHGRAAFSENKLRADVYPEWADRVDCAMSAS